MKKTVSINLNGILFNIDDDAYLLLENYLRKVEAHFSGQEGVNEIMNDIEARIAEILNEKLGNTKTVVSLANIEEVIKTMGEPDEFAGTEDKREYRTSYTSGSQHYKRMYRDPDNSVLGGVCGGIGAYTDVDPVIFRILFVVAFLGFGAGLLIYIILWIVIPEAKTTAQKLEMRGEQPNASNIGNFIRDEFESVKNSFKGKRRKGSRKY